MTDAEKQRRLERALAQGGNTHTIADVVQMLNEGKARFWSQGDGYIVTEIQEFPQKKAVNYWLCFGRLRDVLALEHDINPWAIEQGCSVAVACGRPGWLRAAGPTGWRLHGYAYTKALIDG